MRITYRIVADCDPPPAEDYVQTHGDELDRKLRDAVAAFLEDAGAGASIDVSVSVEP